MVGLTSYIKYLMSFNAISFRIFYIWDRFEFFCLGFEFGLSRYYTQSAGHLIRTCQTLGSTNLCTIFFKIRIIFLWDQLFIVYALTVLHEYITKFHVNNFSQNLFSYETKYNSF